MPAPTIDQSVVGWVGGVLCSASTMHGRTMKTNAVRILDKLEIPYQLREYDVDPNDLSAEVVAAKVQMPLRRHRARREKAIWGVH